MQDSLADALAILIACLIIAGFTVAVILFRPAARRQRRHKRHSRRPKIDLLKVEPTEAATKNDA